MIPSRALLPAVLLVAVLAVACGSGNDTSALVPEATATLTVDAPLSAREIFDSVRDRMAAVTSGRLSQEIEIEPRPIVPSPFASTTRAQVTVDFDKYTYYMRTLLGGQAWERLFERGVLCTRAPTPGATWKVERLLAGTGPPARGVNLDALIGVTPTQLEDGDEAGVPLYHLQLQLGALDILGQLDSIVDVVGTAARQVDEMQVDLFIDKETLLIVKEALGFSYQSRGAKQVVANVIRFEALNTPITFSDGLPNGCGGLQL